MRLSTARHSYRDHVQVKVGDLKQPTYKMATWSFDRVVRIPVFSFAIRPDDDDSTVVGIAVLRKYQVCLWSMFTVDKCTAVLPSRIWLIQQWPACMQHRSKPVLGLLSISTAST